MNQDRDSSSRMRENDYDELSKRELIIVMTAQCIPGMDAIKKFQQHVSKA